MNQTIDSPNRGCSRLKRWATHLFIAGYLAALLYGVVAHAIGFNRNTHLGMYFIVWDMYYGWDSFEIRRHLVGEGESGEYYDLSPPWKELTPFWAEERHHFDYLALHSGRVATNTLRHVQVEPIERIFVVEEAWSKKYNLSEDSWKRRFDEPRQKLSYFYIRGIFEPDGRCVRRHIDWKSHLVYQSMMNNPRLRNDVVRGRTHIQTDGLSSGSSVVQPAAYLLPGSTTGRNQSPIQ
jgi:hypothetical protein